MLAKRFWILMLLLAVLMAACSFSQGNSSPGKQGRTLSPLFDYAYPERSRGTLRAVVLEYY